jgi:hypothetical protein
MWFVYKRPKQWPAIAFGERLYLDRVDSLKVRLESDLTNPRGWHWRKLRYPVRRIELERLLRLQPVKPFRKAFLQRGSECGRCH